MREYRYIIVPIVTLVLAQLIKFTIESVDGHKWKWGRLLSGSGGMPSSHTSFTFSLATAIGIGEGFTSPLYAISLVFSMVVAYDAMGLRMESGKQAATINHIMDEMFGKNAKVGFRKLKEELGHNPAEVVAGILFGSFAAWSLMTILG